MSLRMCGKVVFVKNDVMGDDKKKIKRIQILSNGDPEQRAQLFDVTDMNCHEWPFGQEVDIPVRMSVHQGKNGMFVNWMYFGPTVMGRPGSAGDAKKGI